MTEQVPWSDPGELEPGDEGATASGEEPSTGVPAVDRVLADLDRLDGLPIEEHLGAFEQAHGALRAALDTPAEATGGEQPRDQPGEPA